MPLMPDHVISRLWSRLRPAAWVGAGLGGVLAGTTIALWGYYGSAVFFETVMAGLAFCF